MPKSLSELRKEKDQPASLPMRIVKVCLDQGLLADIQRLTAEKSDLVVADSLRSADDGGEKSGPPKRAGQGANPRLAEIDTELEPLYQRLRDTEGELALRATEGGKWLRWKAEHPAQKDNEADEHLAYGFCSAADLADDLGKYVVSWNDEEFAPGEWDGWFRGKVAPADLGACVSAVVELMEQRVSAPKLPSSLSEPLTSETD